MAEQWRILVVEGDENLNWNIVNVLQKDGYIVLGVTSGAEAIRTLWSEEYDVVICSQQMPDADGFDLLQWMRTYCPNARMVMLGQPGGGISRTQALEMGVASYLDKPPDLHALKEELRRLLHQTGFSASLDSFDLLDVIQIITMSRKSIALVVNTGLEEQGMLRFQGGELIWAEYGTLRGEEAFFALAAHKNGTVVHRPWSEQITPNVTQPLSRLIFQALQYRSKYAEYQQMSSELEAVKPNGLSAGSSPLAPSTVSSLLQESEEVDDTPFQFISGELSPARPQVEIPPYEQAWGNGPASVRADQRGASRSENTTSASDSQKKAWWEPTGPFPALQPSANLSAVTDGGPEQGFARNGSVNITPSTVHKTAVGQNSTLPSWLTDQPTNRDLPVLRGNTGQMPVPPPVERSPVLPKTPPTGVPSSPLPSLSPSLMGPAGEPSLERPAQARPNGFNPADSGLRKIDPEESMFTTPHRAVKNNSVQTARPAEWQGPTGGTASGNTGQMGLVAASGSSERKGDTLQSLAALKRGGPLPTAAHNMPTIAPTPQPAPPISQPPTPQPAPPVSQPVIPTASSTFGEPRTGSNGVYPAQPAPRPASSEAPRVERASTQQSRRNYPALAAALQTLGYSVSGFIATAVVGLDGTPIAQVAVDEMDISPLCKGFSLMIQGATQVVGTERGGVCQHVIITSNTQHIVLRLLNQTKEAFQVLITSREAAPAESLDVLANVEAALISAL